MSVYEGRMTARIAPSQPLHRAATAAAWLVLGLGLSGCANMSDSMTSAFADPAKYSLYECKQLEVERKNLAVRAADLQGLMAKAETGVAGPVVAELAYRNDYIAVRGQSKLAEEAWQSNRCVASVPVRAGDPGNPGSAGTERQACAPAGSIRQRRLLGYWFAPGCGARRTGRLICLDGQISGECANPVK